MANARQDDERDTDAYLKAGASDYITNPVDIERLLSLLRVWLYDVA